MAESESAKPLLEQEGASPPPPPAYLPAEDVSVPQRVFVSTMPLPTYDQSEKYEKDGVLEYHPKDSEEEMEEEEEEEEEEAERDVYQGNCCDFVVFFLICAIFSVVGYLFSFCLAATTAAQSGAIAGLGIAFITKPIVFEHSDTTAFQNFWRNSYCNSDYWGPHHDMDPDLCVRRGLMFFRFIFWVIGLIGLCLLFKGLSNYCKTRSRPRPRD